MAYKSFEDLDVWKRACRLCLDVYEALKGCNDHGLKDQMTRAAVSIASNIAEGAERNTPRDFIRFLNIAKGSAAELRTQLYIAQQVSLIQNKQAAEMMSELKQLSAMLHGLVQSIKRQMQ